MNICKKNVSEYFNGIALCHQNMMFGKYLYFIVDDSLIDESAGTPNEAVLTFISRIKNFGAKTIEFEAGYEDKMVIGLPIKKIRDSFLQYILSLASTLKASAESEGKTLSDIFYIFNLDKHTLFYETDENLDFAVYNNKDFSKKCYEVQTMDFDEILDLDSTKLTFFIHSEFTERYTKEELEILTSPELSDLITLIETNRGIGVYVVGTGSGGAILKQDKINAILAL